MGTSYDQLSEQERLRIYHWHANGRSIRQIGADLGRDPSTISRELRRNSKPTKQWRGGYDPMRAQALAERRRRWDPRFKLARQPHLRKLVRDGLAMGVSPEQIAGRLALIYGSTVISHEAIYRYIYHRSAQKDYWHKLLARKKHQRGRTTRRNPIEHIQDRVSIDQRDPAVLTRQQPGHWETDLLLFSNKKSNILVLQERTSRITRLASQPNKKAARVRKNLQRRLKPLPPPLRLTLTQDNGTEFAQHHKLAHALGIQTFFCDPRSPWQKPSVENTNGRLRRWLPLKANANDITPARIKAIENRLNATPRKCLGFKTPQEVFSEHLLHFKRESTFLLAQE